MPICYKFRIGKRFCLLMASLTTAALPGPLSFYFFTAGLVIIVSVITTIFNNLVYFCVSLVFLQGKHIRTRKWHAKAQ